MAENIEIQKSDVDKITECSLCKNKLNQPSTLKYCLHSYCKSCIEAIPKQESNGFQGWFCPKCNQFSEEKEIDSDFFIVKLLNVNNDSTMNNNEAAICSQCDREAEVSGKCVDCKLELCEKCQFYHRKIPMLKTHKIVPIEESDEKNVIDQLIFCSIHADELIKLNCRACQKLICLMCKATEHDDHNTEVIASALERVRTEMANSSKQISQNVDVMKLQIKGVSSKIEEIKESYASCRLDMDDHIEKVISGLRAMKAQVEDEVTEQESIALDSLDGIKKDLQYKVSEATNILQLNTAVSDYFRGVSLLAEIHGDLYTKARNLGAYKKDNIDFTIPEVTFMKSEDVDSKFKEVFGDVRFDEKRSNIDSSGKVIANITVRNIFGTDLSVKLPDHSVSVSTGWDNLFGTLGAKRSKVSRHHAKPCAKAKTPAPDTTTSGFQFKPITGTAAGMFSSESSPSAAKFSFGSNPSAANTTFTLFGSNPVKPKEEAPFEFGDFSDLTISKKD